MGSLNQVTLVGNLGKDAELRYTTGGAAVATLNLATTESWTDKEGQKQEKTEWHRIVVWGKTAESLQEYLTKGKQICVVGSLQTRKWEKDGVTRYTTEIKAHRVQLLGGGSGGGGSRRRDEVGGDNVADMPMDEPSTDAPIDDSDIPFAVLLPIVLTFGGWIVG